LVATFTYISSISLLSCNLNGRQEPARSVVCVSVCVLVTRTYDAKAAGDDVWGLTLVGSRNHVRCIRLGSRLDERIRSHEGWHVNDAAFCQITL